MTGNRIGEVYTPEPMPEVQPLEMRRGFPVYDINPSVKDVVPSVRNGQPLRIERDGKALIYNATDGQIFGQGSVAFVERRIVDTDQFIKVYMEDLKSMFDLSKTGQRIFQIVWMQIRMGANQDKVELTPKLARARGTKISDRAFQKGVRELLEREFIYMSLIDGVYYINMLRFFNGNRIIKLREYTLEGTETQETLPLSLPPE